MDTQKIVTGIVLIIVLVGVYFGLSYLFGKNVRHALVPEVESGKIYLTLTKENSANDRKEIGIYAYDFETGAVEEFFAPSAATIITGGISSDGSKVVASTNHYSKDVHYFQLYTLKDDGKVKRITDSRTIRKREPQWSPNGDKIVFSALDDVSDHLKLPELTASGDISSMVYVTDLDGNEVRISDGSHPRFLPSGNQVLILKKDGLYVFEADGSKGKKVWHMNEGNAFFNMHLDLSGVSDMVAWSLFDEGEILLIKMESWDPFVGKIVDRIKTHALWPKFSPDGEKLAMIEVDYDWAGWANPKLVSFDLKTSEKRFLADLEGFSQFFMTLDSWY
ncbi:MAG: hypothetical protein ABII97_01985 [Patescibacteria group bacterium]